MWRLAMALAFVLAGPAPAQQGSPVLVIDQERLFTESAFGERVAREIERRSTELATENRQIEAQLMAEERDLTERRAGLDPAEFRELADAFDEKVQRLRAQQDQKARDLARLRDEEQQAFVQTIGPILSELVRERGASVVLERRAVFLSSDAVDITDEAIARIDAGTAGSPPASDPTEEPEPGPAD